MICCGRIGVACHEVASNPEYKNLPVSEKRKILTAAIKRGIAVDPNISESDSEKLDVMVDQLVPVLTELWKEN